MHLLKSVFLILSSTLYLAPVQATTAAQPCMVLLGPTNDGTCPQCTDTATETCDCNFIMQPNMPANHIYVFEGAINLQYYYIPVACSGTNWYIALYSGPDANADHVGFFAVQGADTIVGSWQQVLWGTGTNIMSAHWWANQWVPRGIGSS